MHTPLDESRAPAPRPESVLQYVYLSLAAILCLLRFVYLGADFPNHSPWLMDQAKYTDEGWWASGAVRHFLLGHWNVAGDYNPAIAVPVWPLLLAAVFKFTGVSLLAARSVSVLFSIGTVGLVYLLVRRYGDGASAAVAALLLAASPFAFAFSRLATLDTVVVFEFCLLLWVAAEAEEGSWWPAIALGLLIPIALLTKTTVLVLLPAVLWLLWSASGKRKVRAIAIVFALAAAGFGTFVSLVDHSRWAEDYHYFFDINAMAEVVWKQTGYWLLKLLQHGLWVDRVMYPAATVILIVALVWMRPLWRNPLFTACWIALAGEAVFVLRRQDDYAPRYFLAMLPPMIMLLVLAWQRLRPHARARSALAAVLAVGYLLNLLQIFGFLTHHTYDYRGAADAIQKIVRSDATTHPLLLGSSGDQLSLMIGVPAINDGYSSEDLAEKAKRLQPGWYIGWNDMDQDILGSLSAYRLDKVATYRVMDHDERNLLTLYRMVRLQP